MVRYVVFGITVFCLWLALGYPRSTIQNGDTNVMRGTNAFIQFRCGANYN